MRRRKPMRVPTYEQLHGTQPDLSERSDVRQGILRHRVREDDTERGYVAPCPDGHNPITG
jgi:hypothetical protein